MRNTINGDFSSIAAFLHIQLQVDSKSEDVICWRQSELKDNTMNLHGI